MFAKMAVVNLAKHRKRTVLIVFAVMASVLVMEVVAGMFHGIRDNFFRNVTQETGHVQVTAAGRREALNPFSLDHVIPEYRRVVEDLSRLEGAVTVEAALEFGAILQHGERSVTIGGIGVDRDTQFFRNVGAGLEDGVFPPEPGGVVLSRSISELLGVAHGEAILLVVEDSTGSPFYLQFSVSGVFRTDAREFDENTFFLTHADAEDLLYLEGATTGIRVRLDAQDRASVFADRVTEILAGREGPPLVAETFREIHAGLVNMIETMDFFIVFMNLFVVIVAASVITNAILMNVFERIREFGTMRAIGLKKRGVARIILTEGVVQGIAGSLLGLLAGIPIVLYFSSNGIDMGGIAEAFGMGTSHFYFGYTPRNSALNAGGGVLIALGGSLYAAVTGVRLTIMEALRYE